MNLFLGAAFFALGAAGASFAGLIVARYGSGEPIVLGRSRCDACGRTLAPSALVPVLSYCASAGRARCCGARISAWSPVSESALGALFVLSYGALGAIPALIPFLAALVFILMLVGYDLAHHILPPLFLGGFLLASFSYALLASSGSAAFGLSLATAGALALLLAFITLVSGGRAMGLADAPLAFGLALLAGPLALSGFLYSFWIGAVVGIAVLLIRPGGPTMGIEVPFAPFLALGFLLAFFTGWNIFTIIGF